MIRPGLFIPSSTQTDFRIMYVCTDNVVIKNYPPTHLINLVYLLSKILWVQCIRVEYRSPTPLSYKKIFLELIISYLRRNLSRENINL